MQFHHLLLRCVARLPAFGSAYLNAIFYSAAFPLGGQAIAAVLFVADVMKPDCFRRGGGIWLKLLGSILVLGSLAAAIGVVSGGQLLGDERQTDIRITRGELATLEREALPAETLRKLSKETWASAKREANRGCKQPPCHGKTYEGLVAEAMEFDRRLGIAEKRVHLEAKLERISATAPPENALIGFLRAEIGVDAFVAVMIFALAIGLLIEAASIATPHAAESLIGGTPRRSAPEKPKGGRVDEATKKRIVREARRLMQRSGESQTAVADRLEVPQSTLNRWMREDQAAQPERRRMLRLVK